MHAGLPVSVMVAAPDASIVTALVTAALTVAGPSAPMVASFDVRPDASSEEIPRMIAVSFPALPEIAPPAVPERLMRS